MNPDTGKDQCNHVDIGSSVNVANGNLFDDHEISPDANLPITLYYNSRSEREGLFGFGWNGSIDIRLLINSDDSVVLIDADGREDLFTANGDGTFISQAGNYDTLAEVDEGYQLSRKNGETVLFDPDGKPVQIEDKNGNATTYGFDGEQLLDIIGVDDRMLFFASDANNRITKITDATGKSSTFTYDADGNLISITNAAGQSWSFSFDADHNLTSKTDPLGQTTQYTYNSDDRLLGSTDAAGIIRSVEYISDTVTKFTDPAGNTTEYTFNDNQNITKEVDAQGNVTEYTWDENLNKTSITDASGTITYAYDADGNMLSRTDQQNYTNSYTYDGKGNILTITDSEGNVTTNTYDARGNLISTADAGGNTTTFHYDEKGHLIKVTDANNKSTTFAYNPSGNLISITDPTGATITMTYDTAGNMMTITDANGATTTYTYDALNRPIAVADAKGNVTTYAYDALGSRTSVTDANSNTSRFEYDHKQRIVKIIDALGQATSLTYTESGCSTCNDTGSDKPTSLTDTNGNTTWFTYDSLSRLIKETGPLGNATTYGHDAKGNLISRTDANGNSTTYTHDALGRLLEKTYPDETTATFSYDSKGNVISAANQHISYAMSYDTLGRLVQITDSNDRTISYAYDATGNPIRLTTPDNDVVTYGYDEAGRLKQIDSFAGSFVFDRDSLGRRSSLSYPNGVTTSYDYDAAGRLVEILGQDDNGKLISYFAYSHDKVGNRQSMTTEDMLLEYSYDKIYRLLETVPSDIKKKKTITHDNKSEIFAYDPVGNRLEGPDAHDFYEHNNGNQVVADHKYSYQYDAQGNLTGKSAHDGTSSWSYEWDYDNRLVRVAKSESNTSTVVSFKYDPFGRRIEKEVAEYSDGLLTDSSVFTYIYAGEDIIQEIVTSGGNKGKGEVTSYVHGPGIDEPLALKQKGNIYFYHADGLGSIAALTDERGKVVQSYEYTSFGQPKRHADVVKQPYSYTGREWDEEIDLYFYRARYYDPVAGTFISKDPIGFAGGDVNLYGYASLNPINRIDPFGLDDWGKTFNVPSYSLTGDVDSQGNFYMTGAELIKSQIQLVSPLTQGEKDALVKVAGGGSAIAIGAITKDPKMIGGGIVMTSEGILLGVIEFGFDGDTSSIPSPWEVLFGISSGVKDDICE